MSAYKCTPAAVTCFAIVAPLCCTLHRGLGPCTAVSWPRTAQHQDNSADPKQLTMETQWRWRPFPSWLHFLVLPPRRLVESDTGKRLC